MGLKTRNVNSSPLGEDHWKSTWGEISTSEVRCIKFIRESHGVEECWTYPHETLVRWVLKKSEPEEIKIIAGGDIVTIRGYGLERLMEGLDLRSLKIVRHHPVRFSAMLKSSVRIIGIDIESFSS